MARTPGRKRVRTKKKTMRRSKGPTLIDFMNGNAETLLPREGKAEPAREVIVKHVPSIDTGGTQHHRPSPETVPVHGEAMLKQDEQVETTSLPVPQPAQSQVQDNETQTAFQVELSFHGEIRDIGFIDTIAVPDYVSQVAGYLMEVRYDGETGKASLLVYDPSDGRVKIWLDKTGHRPYFLVRAPPKDVKAKLETIASKYGRGGDKAARAAREASVQQVQKMDLLEMKPVLMTRVVVSNPLDVPLLRKYFSEEGAWEADIPYHQNYIYDRGLIPGMPYVFTNDYRNPIRVGDWKVPDEVVDKIASLFEDESVEERQMAMEWIPVFEVPPPPAELVAIDIEVLNPPGVFPEASQAQFPVNSISIISTNGEKKVFVLARPGLQVGIPDENYPRDATIEIYDSERNMLLNVFAYLKDKPVIVSFNGDNFDLVYLENRARMLGIEEDCIPFRRKENMVLPRNGIHIDLYKVFDNRSLQIYAFGGAYREKNLDAIATALLGVPKLRIEKEIYEYTLSELVAYNYRDAKITLDLIASDGKLVWNLLVLIQRISKLGIEDVSRSQVSSWTKSLMYWEHRRRGYLIPRKEDLRQRWTGPRAKAIIKDKKYQGAIVFDPPPGVFFDVVVLDFASLYPSIIKEWNLSYETIREDDKCKNYKIVPFVNYKVCMDHPGLTSMIVGLLRDFRVKIYKKKAKDKSLKDLERKWYNVVQSAMKVYINASYGVFGSEAFKLYSLPVAESVTAVGRKVILDTKRKAEEMNLYILYGDTDSVFIWNPPKEKLVDLQRYVKEEYNLDLEMDKVYRFILFSGLKKNYLGVYPDGSVEIKGMVGKKSNTPEFLKQEFKRVVNIIAEMQEPEDVEITIEKVKDVIAELQSKLKHLEYTLDELSFNVMMQKDIDQYKKNMPQHVKAAKLLVSYGINVGRGDVIRLVKVRSPRGGLGVKPVQLAKVTEIDIPKYLEYVKTSFEQILASFGVRWEQLTIYRTL